MEETARTRDAASSTRWLRLIWCVVAALPLAAAGYWCSLSSVLPESFTERAALGEVTPRWDFDHWAAITNEPLHFIARLAHLAALNIPGATVGSVVWLNFLCLLLLVATMAAVARSSIGGDGAALAATRFLLFGLLFASPSWGATWLHGQRVGVLLTAAMFALALRLLSGKRRMALRAWTALILSAIAPFTHLHGALIGFALIPMMLACARANDSRRGVAWIGSLLLVTNVAAAISLRAVPGFGVGEADWFSALATNPGATLAELLRAIGASWLDFLPLFKIDEYVLGAATLLLPLLALWAGDRSPEARTRCAPWWSCLSFGVLIVLAGALRYDGLPAVGSLREATYGSCFVPIGALGVLAARFGRELLVVPLGGLLVITTQDWHRGIETLRLANMRAQRLQAEVSLGDSVPDGGLGRAVRAPNQWTQLRERGWVPALDDVVADPIASFDGPSDGRGHITDGTAATIRGQVRSSLRAAIQRVAVVAFSEGAPPRVVGYARPDFENAGRSVTWEVRLDAPLADGTTVRATGYLVDRRAFAPMGAPFIVENGRLRVSTDS